jgi:hypothetical protein
MGIPKTELDSRKQRHARTDRWRKACDCDGMSMGKIVVRTKGDPNPICMHCSLPFTTVS